MNSATAPVDVRTRNEQIVRLALTKLGRVVCRHSFQLIQHRHRLFLRCPDCGRETVGIVIGGIPETRQ